MGKAATILRQHFPFAPTEGQGQLLHLFEEFFHSDHERPVLLLRGYAGTGKTTSVSAIVKSLPTLRYKSVLMAPTGRAAKVMAAYSGRQSFTIHKMIYRLSDSKGGNLRFRRQQNYFTNTLFIVDEASMLSDDAEFGTSSLLSDLFEFVFEQPSNKLMLIGDDAQLPPVGKTKSPGLLAGYLKANFRATVYEALLTQVMRQDADSGILFNATTLRNELPKEQYTIRFRTSAFTDIYKMTGERLEDGIRYAHDKYGVENTVIITRSNKAAVQYNQYIRNRIFWHESELEAGDILMIVRNNYYFVPEESPVGFLANGDFAEVMKIVREEEMHGFRFADLRVRMLDYPDQEPIEIKILLDTLHSDTPSLSQSEYQQLAEAVAADYADLPKNDQRKGMREDPYLHAVQVKFAYALTCHKSQGGQWPAVFVDQGYLTEEMVDREYIRWLYTAITRASKELFLVNFAANFFK